MIDDRSGCQSSGYRFQSTGTASDTSARAAFAQSMSFCTMGAPLSPIAPTTSPSTLMGNPPPHRAARASVGMPAKSDGSPWIKLKKSCVETPNRAVYAVFCAISMQRIGAPSIRRKALRLPPSSRIATFSVTPSSLAFATAAFTIFCASSEEMLCFFTMLAIGFAPLDMYCALIGCTSHSNDDLSELAVVLQIAMNFHHVVELECAIDDRLERAALQAFEDKFHRGLPACFVAGRAPDVVPPDDRHLGDHREHRHRGVALGERAVDVDRALEGQRGNQLREVRSADRFEHDARTLAIGDPHHFLDQVDLFRGDHMRGASFDQLLPL